MVAGEMTEVVISRVLILFWWGISWKLCFGQPSTTISPLPPSTTDFENLTSASAHSEFSTTPSKVDQYVFKDDNVSTTASEGTTHSPGITTVSPEGITNSPEIVNVTESTETVATIDPYHCEEDWVTFQGSCYFFSEDYQNWFRAQANCLEMFGHLAVINSTTENDFLKQKSKEDQHNIWIDGLDLHGNGNWKWATERKNMTRFVDWNGDKVPVNTEVPENPEVQYPFCSYISSKVNRWNSGDCAHYGYYVCEKEMKV